MSLLPLLAPLLREVVAQAVRRRLRGLVFQLAAGLCLLVALLALIVALWFRLANAIGPVPASLWLAGGAMISALVLLLIGRMVSGRGRSRDAPLDELFALLEREAQTLGGEAEKAARAAPLTSAGGAFALGLLLARLLR